MSKHKCIVRVLPMWTHNPPGKVISTVSRSNSGFSPFLLGPCKLYAGYEALVMENAWQFSKVYPCHMEGSKILPSYRKWAKEGWADQKAHRYPMGKGVVPVFSLWGSRRLSYVKARKVIYGPLYAEAVQQTITWECLQDDYKTEKEITLLDYDAYDHRKEAMSLSDVLNNPKRKMGHAFILMMLLTKDKALDSMELR